MIEPLYGETTPVSEDRFVEASTAARAVLAVVVIVGLLGFWMSQWASSVPVPPPDASSEEFDRYTRLALLWSWILFGVNVLMAAGFSIYFGRMGLKGIAAGEFPPSGTLVVRRTKIRTGAFAKFSSCLAVVLAVAIWAPVLLLAYGLFLIEHAI